MSKIALTPNASGTGTLTVAAPNTNTDRTLTLPDITGTLVSSDASGNVGIGTSSPQGKLDVSGNAYVSAAGLLAFRNNTPADYGYLGQGSINGANATDFAIRANLGGISFATNGATERMRIDASGNVGIGTSSPAFKVDAQTPSGTNVAINATKTGTDAAQMGVDTGPYINGGANLGLRVGGTERMRIDASGNLLVGTTSVLNVFTGSTDGLALEGSGTYVASRNNSACGYFRRRSSNGEMLVFLRDTTDVGSIDVTTTSTSYNTSSDYRLKENVQPMQNALDTVAQLNPVTYTWKADGSAGQGFIAHELQAVVPDCVTGTKDAVDADGNPQYQGVDTSFLVATLVKAIQELTARIAVLEAK